MSTLNSPYDVPEDQRRVDVRDIDTEQMTVKELRRLVEELEAVPDEATFSLRQLTERYALNASWTDPVLGATGIHIRRSCPCGHADCPDRKDAS